MRPVTYHVLGWQHVCWQALLVFILRTGTHAEHLYLRLSEDHQNMQWLASQDSVTVLYLKTSFCLMPFLAS